LNFSNSNKNKVKHYVTSSEACIKFLEDLSTGKEKRKSKAIYKDLNSSITFDENNMHVHLRRKKYSPTSKLFASEKSSETSQLTNVY
jgi:hypothetical protein